MIIRTEACKNQGKPFRQKSKPVTDIEFFIFYLIANFRLAHRRFQKYRHNLLV
jgi:hypothetical protein